MSDLVKSIGFLATGSELVSGEILNTNGQQMAQSLQSKGVHLGKHVIVDGRTYLKGNSPFEGICYDNHIRYYIHEVKQ